MNRTAPPKPDNCTQPSNRMIEAFREDIKRQDTGRYDDRVFLTCFQAKKILAEIDALMKPDETTESQRIERLENAVREAIYEVTHLSSAAWDGYYTPRVHNQAVDRWRAALRPAVEPAGKPSRDADALSTIPTDEGGST